MSSIHDMKLFVRQVADMRRAQKDLRAMEGELGAGHPTVLLVRQSILLLEQVTDRMLSRIEGKEWSG